MVSLIIRVPERQGEGMMEIGNLVALKDLKEMASQYAKEMDNGEDLARMVIENQKPLTPLAEKILTAIKEEKELTYVEAYAALELVRKRLELESKFVFVGK